MTQLAQSPNADARLRRCKADGGLLWPRLYQGCAEFPKKSIYGKSVVRISTKCAAFRTVPHSAELIAGGPLPAHENANQGGDGARLRLRGFSNTHSHARHRPTALPCSGLVAAGRSADCDDLKLRLAPLVNVSRPQKAWCRAAYGMAKEARNRGRPILGWPVKSLSRRSRRRLGDDRSRAILSVRMNFTGRARRARSPPAPGARPCRADCRPTKT
jgi:hypothetical protein